MASIQFGPDDRDTRGFIKLAEPRTLADLLPPPPAAAAPPTIRRVPPTRAEWVAMGALLLLLLALAAYLLGSAPDRPAERRPAAPAATLAPTVPATAIPTIAPAPVARMLVAFAAPDGAVLGAVEATRAITPTAHYGDSWIQADVSGSGLVWLRASDWPALAIVGPDLAPRPTATAAPYVPPPPPPCAVAGIPGKMVEVCGWGDIDAQARAQWIEQYGGNAGIVTTPTPNDWSRP